MRKKTILAQYCTDIGPVRPTNQDNLYFNGLDLNRHRTTASDEKAFRQYPMLFAVCDGMGGERRGDEASFLAVKLLPSCHRALLSDPKKAFDLYTAQANEAILQLGRAGSTLVALALYDDFVTIAYLGDSRAYYSRDGNLTLLTEDHTEHRILNDERGSGNRNILTRHLGMDLLGLVIRPSYRTVSIQRGDCLLLCSDGLTGVLDDESIASILKVAPHPAQALVKAAMQSGSEDNMTALVVKVM